MCPMTASIKQDIESLISLYETKKAENAELRSQIAIADQEISSLKEQIEERRREIENLRLKTTVVPGSEESEIAKKKIDALIRQIDKCIETLEAL